MTPLVPLLAVLLQAAALLGVLAVLADRPALAWRLFAWVALLAVLLGLAALGDQLGRWPWPLLRLLR